MEIIKNEPADILIYISGIGVVLKEKSLIAIDSVSQKIIAVGTGAEHIAENCSENVQVLSPLRQGMIADYLASVKLFTLLLQKAWGKKPLRRSPIAICVPNGIVEVEKKAIEDAIYQSGAREIFITDIPFDQFVKELPIKLPKLSRKYSTIIGITKDEPEKYIREQLSHVLSYAGQEGVSPERVKKLLTEMSDEQDSSR